VVDGRTRAAERCAETLARGKQRRRGGMRHPGVITARSSSPSSGRWKRRMLSRDERRRRAELRDAAALRGPSTTTSARYSSNGDKSVRSQSVISTIPVILLFEFHRGQVVGGLTAGIYQVGSHRAYVAFRTTRSTGQPESGMRRSVQCGVATDASVAVCHAFNGRTASAFASLSAAAPHTTLSMHFWRCAAQRSGHGVRRGRV